ncbi:MAG: glycogen/starch synthase [Sedimentisphaerales bacterium]|nr:glycogen/starch synthase [Sedimentisphaerales bacterium]
MPLVTFYFELHQPYRLHPDVNKFLWDEKNHEVFHKVAEKNYLPATRMFTEIIRENPNFKITFSMSGTFLKQAQQYQPEVIKALHELLDAGKPNNQVEYLEETFYHSLAGLFHDPKKTEFKDQVSHHRQKMKEVFGIKPSSFRNTELMYNNEIANIVADMDYKAILCEQRDDMFRAQDGRAISPNAVFKAMGRRGKTRNLIVIPRNRNLSDDIAFRFKDQHMSAEQYAEFIARVDGEVVMLGYDYEHIGEHLWADTGIFDFWRSLARTLANHPSVVMANPTEIAERFMAADCPTVDIHPLSTSSWADVERNTYGWLGNQTQYTLFQDLEAMESEARAAGGELLQRWRLLTTSDHLYYLHEGKGADRSVHDYFSPYGSLSTATYLLTRNIDFLKDSIKRFNIQKKSKSEVTPVIIIAPETAQLPGEGMGKLAQLVSGKSGGMGEVISALCKGLLERDITTHIITLNLRRRFQLEAHLTDSEWVQSRHKLHPEHVHLISSSVFENNWSAYEGDPVGTAAEFQRQIINIYLKEIRSRYEGRAIIHSHDWMAGGAITAYANLRQVPVLHTIHNTHTSNIPLEALWGVNLGKIMNNLYLCWDQGHHCIDSQATAIKNATRISYVGKTFLKEIVNDFFLDRPIIPWSVREETKSKYYLNAALVVPNGISSDLYPENQLENPDPDQPGLAKKYGPDDAIIEAKKANLVKFQKQIGLNVDPDAILLYWPSRLDSSQKGIELLEDIALKFVIENPDVQIAVVGNPVGPSPNHSDIIGKIACASGGKIAYHGFDEHMSILGYAAASDVFGASLYEPFGQIDVMGNIYGATATNRDTGGYSDKIHHLSLKALGAPLDQGNGVLFKNYDSGGLWWGLTHTVEHHRYFQKHPREWEKQARRIMKDARINWSLENMIAGYITVYEQLNNSRPLG